MKTPAASREKNGLELVEEAFYLLRTAPVPVLATYYVGALPFILALLYYVSDMSRSAFAAERLFPASFGLAVLFLWMKAWQAGFTARLSALLAQEPAPRWTAAGLARMLAVQAFLQPAGLLFLPFSVVLLVPFGWVYAFYANVTVLGQGQDPDFSSLWKRVWRQTFLAPRQNHLALVVFKLMAMFVFSNLALALGLLPLLLKTLLGVETVFSQSPWAMLNTTFFTVVLGLTYLGLDPFLKATYALRCFYGESVRSGRDMRAMLKAFRARDFESVPAKAALGLALFFLLSAPQTRAAPKAGSSPPNPIESTRPVRASELNRAIDDVVKQREYTWRMPRYKQILEKESQGRDLSWLERIGRSLENAFRGMDNRLRKLFDWLTPNRRAVSRASRSGGSWLGAMRALLIVLIVILIALVTALLVRWWRQRPQTEGGTLLAETPPPRPDLADETVGADQLPESEWLGLARELMAHGDLRLALRAFYLASLAHLAEQNLIAIARFKSNHDYERELDRRGHALPGVVELFSRNVTVFDRVWYGLHEVTGELLDQFSANVNTIREAT
jgi:Domain of unknown function (DUF4129)